jgi:nicotinamidase/pyrazinamidase
MADQALLVIDLQIDFCPGGALAVAGGDEIVPLVNGLVQSHEHVLLTQDWHPAHHSSFASSHPGRAPFETIDMPYGPQTLWPDHCIQGSGGAAFHPNFNRARSELILRNENDRATPTGLGGYLRERGIKSLTLVGLATDFCVGFSALDAVAQGFAATVRLDACRGIDIGGSMDAMLGRMRAAGVTLA